jgi:hypothetical protein
MYGYRPVSTGEQLLDLFRTGAARLQTWLASTSRSQEPRTAEELIEWAHHYEATQPSYAADLHAAALRYQEEHPGR